jgi:Holliday junction resolvasome RuvABC endonuclease subunit
VRYVGIDLGVRKIAMTFLAEDELVNAWAFEAASELSRPLQLRELAGIAQSNCELFGAESVWIEDVIIGNNRKYSIRLAETKGAVLAALAQLRLGLGTDIRGVDNKTWKKTILGNGNATKDEAKNYIIDTYPAYAPVCGDDQDLYDAACIGLYGRFITTQSQGLQL